MFKVLVGLVCCY